MNTEPARLDEQVERLKLALGLASDTALGKALGISQSGIFNAKRRGNIPHKWFVRVATECNVRLEWLITGTGEMRPEEAHEALSGCHKCDVLHAKLDMVNDRLYKAMQDNSELLRENGELKELLAAREASLRATEESLGLYKKMLIQAQQTLAILDKTGVTEVGAPAFSLPYSDSE